MYTNAVVSVHFEQDSYTTSENVMVFEFCVVVNEPFERPFLARVTTTPATAEGNSIYVAVTMA